jgi:hypothetical protein
MGGLASLRLPIGDLDLRVLANARRAEEKENGSEDGAEFGGKLEVGWKKTVLDSNSKQFDRAGRKQ